MLIDPSEVAKCIKNDKLNIGALGYIVLRKLNKPMSVTEILQECEASLGIKETPELRRYRDTSLHGCEPIHYGNLATYISRRRTRREGEGELARKIAPCFAPDSQRRTRNGRFTAIEGMEVREGEVTKIPPPMSSSATSSAGTSATASDAPKTYQKIAIDLDRMRQMRKTAAAKTATPPTPTTPAPTPSTPAPTPSTPAPTQSTPASTLSTPAPTPSTPAPTPSTPAPTPTAPAPTPTAPAPTPTAPAPTPTTPASTPTTPASTPTTPAPTKSPYGSPQDGKAVNVKVTNIYGNVIMANIN